MAKAQLTIFIIVGIAIVLSIGVVVYLERQKTLAPIEEYVTPTIAQAPIEVAPIQDFVTSCIELVGKQGLKLIGERGGYINPQESGIVANTANPTEKPATGVQLAPDWVVPYWWHLASKNDCTTNCYFRTERPALGGAGELTIESQLGKYVENNLAGCINDFSQFKEEGFLFEEKGALKVTATVATTTVNFFAEWPLSITKAGSDFSLNEYFAQQTVALRQMYMFATDLTNAEANLSFIGKHIFTVIDGFSEVDSNMLPPASETELGFSGGKYWVKNKVEENLVSALMSYIPLLQVFGTHNYEYIEASPDSATKEFDEAIHKQMLVPILDPYFNLDVNFEYLGQKPYFDLNCDGQLCQPETMGSGLLALLPGISRYNFAYDVSIPVVVTLKDPEAFNGEGYQFKFALEGNIRNNDPLKSDFAPLEIPDLPPTTMFGDLDKRMPDNITITVIDGKTDKPAGEAGVFFSCGDQSASMGATDSSGVLVAQFPGCAGGVVSAQMEDAFPDYANLQTYKEGSQAVTLKLEPYRYLNFELKKHKLQKTADYASIWMTASNSSIMRQVDWSWKFTPDKKTAVALEEDENAIIIMTRKAAAGEDEFFAVADIRNSPWLQTNPEYDLARSVRIIPGTYDVKIDLFKNPKTPIVIPPQADFVFKKKLGKVVAREEWCVPGEAMVFNETSPLYAGSAEFEWTLTKEQLDSGTDIVFYVPYLDLKSVTDTCYKVRDSEDSFTIGERPVGASTNWACMEGRTRTVCERTIEDLDEMENYGYRVNAHPKEFIPDVITR